MAHTTKCLSKSCTLASDDERMVVCWLCHGVCHFKCSGLRTLVAEALHSTKGLHWCCNGCQQIGVEFYRFYQSTKNTFINIQTKMSVLSNEICSYGNLFDEFKQLNYINSPPHSSPKRRKSSRKNNKEHPVLNLGPSSSNGNVPIINNHCLPTENPVLNLGPSSSNSVGSIINNHCLPNSSVTTTNIPTDKDCNIQRVSVPVNNNIVYNPPTINMNNAENELTNQLKIIPPKKSIFISRFAFDTSVEDINFYIKSKLNFGADISINKFTYSQPRSITSFKLTVPANLYETIVNPDFWPNNTLVREYVFKENPRLNNIAQLPPRQFNNSKN